MASYSDRQIYSRPSNDEENIFVLENIPEDFDHSLITDFVEGTLDVDVKEIQMYPYLPGRALVFLQEKYDFPLAKKKIEASDLDSNNVLLWKTSRRCALVVLNNDFQKLSEEFLCLYFESEFADGASVIESSIAFPELNMAVVYFKSAFKTVVERILTDRDLVALPSENYHITAVPFYENFHENISQKRTEGKPQAVEGLDRKPKDKEIKIETEKVEYDSREDSDNDDETEEDSDIDKEETESVNEEEEEVDVETNSHIKHKMDTDENDNSDGEFTAKNELKEADNQNNNMQNNYKSQRGNNKNLFRSNRRGRGRGRNRGRGVNTPHYSRGVSSFSQERKSYDGSNSNHGSLQNLYQQEEEENFVVSQSSKLYGNTRGRGQLRDKTRGKAATNLAYDYNSQEQRNSEMNLSNKKASQHNRGRGKLSYTPSGQGSFDANNVFSYNKAHEKIGLGFDMQSDGGRRINSSVDLQDKEFVKSHKTDTEEFKKEVELKDAKIKELEDRLKTKEQQKSHSDSIPMTPWQAEFLPHCFQEYVDCSVFYDSIKKCAVIKGSQETVSEHSLNLLKELKKIQQEHLVLTPSMQSILTKEHGKNFLKEYNSNQTCKSKLFLEDKSLIIVSMEEDSLRNDVAFLKDHLNYSESIKSDSAIPYEKLVSLQSKLEREYLIKMSWNDSLTEVLIEGCRDDVCKILSDINEVVEEHGVLEKQFTVTGLHASFFNRNLNSEVNPLLVNVTVSDITSTEAQVSLKLKGEKKLVNQAYRKLNELKSKTTEKKWDLRSEFQKPEDLMLIAKGFSSEKMKKKLAQLEEKRKCVIVARLPDVKDYLIKTSKKTQQATKRKAIKTKYSNRESSSDLVPVKPKLLFKLTDKCQLIIKPYGDITKEASDVLVCVVCQRVDLRKTRVGMAFNKLCPNLWKSLKDEHEAHPNDTVLTTKGPFPHLKCQAICHIILTPWDSNTSPSHLSTAVQTVIGQVVSLGLKTVSFPVLGCGRAFGFPAAEVAKYVISCLKSSSLRVNVEKIVLLAPDKELFKEFQTVASQNFTALMSQPLPEASSGAVSKTSEEDTQDDDDIILEESEESEEEEVTVEMPQDSHKSYKAEISIMAKHGSDIQPIWPDFKKEIERVCLYVEYFNQDLVESWPKEIRSEILHEAKKNCVWVQISTNSKNKKPGYMIKGLKPSVGQVHKFIQAEFDKFSSRLPKNRIKSDKAPKRGTLDFLKYAADSDELFPSYWKLSSTKTSFWDKIKTSLASPKEHRLVSVDKKVRDAIQTLINKTWDPSLVGHGNDAAGLSHQGIKVVNVERIENFELFELYSMHRKRFFQRQSQQKRICYDVKKLPNSKGRVVTTENLEDFMKEELFFEVNEHYLFHGTKFPQAIIANGIDPRVSSEGGMFGKGIYMAERFTKSDQYTDSRIARSAPGTKLTMILARVLLGNIYLCNDHHPSVSHKGAQKLTRPPCMHCEKDVCNCTNQTLYDSVMGDGKWLFREFIVYDRHQCYPEYLITYQRV